VDFNRLRQLYVLDKIEEIKGMGWKFCKGVNCSKEKPDNKSMNQKVLGE
jgi:hypothetical protein